MIVCEAFEYNSVLSCYIPGSGEPPIPMIFMITPTHSRTSRVPDIVRLCQTLMHVKHLHWIVVEDGSELSKDVTEVLNWCSVSNIYLNYQAPTNLKFTRGRGADQRNYGMQWLRERYKVGQQPGVVYFGDDDNTYDIRLFEEVSICVVRMIVEEGEACLYSSGRKALFGLYMYVGKGGLGESRPN